MFLPKIKSYDTRTLIGYKREQTIFCITKKDEVVDIYSSKAVGESI